MEIFSEDLIQLHSILGTKISGKEFKFLINDNIVRGKNLEILDTEKNQYLLKNGIVNLDKEEFIGKDDVCLILGDNIFYGAGFKKILKDSVKIVKDEKKAVLFGYHVDDPQRYGVAEFDLEGNVITLQEKPKNPKSNIAVTGLYFYPNNVISFAKKVKPSKRGELEITSLNQVFLKSYKLFIKNLSRGFAWFDTGTIESMSDASEFVKSVEKSTSLKIACLEEIAYIQNWISVDKLKLIIGFGQKSNYHNYLRKLLKQN